jgi:NADPH:quinone reductase-like Zn-dependent oxidoreductase
VEANAGHSYAEYSVIDARAAVPIAENVRYESAAATPIVYSTARHLIHDYDGRAKPGDWVLVRAATGMGGAHTHRNYVNEDEPVDKNNLTSVIEWIA